MVPCLPKFKLGRNGFFYCSLGHLSLLPPNLKCKRVHRMVHIHFAERLQRSDERFQPKVEISEFCWRSMVLRNLMEILTFFITSTFLIIFGWIRFFLFHHRSKLIDHCHRVEFVWRKALFIIQWCLWCCQKEKIYLSYVSPTFISAKESMEWD